MPPITTTTTKPSISSYFSTNAFFSTLYRWLTWVHLRELPIHPNFHVALFTLWGVTSILLFTERAPEEVVPATKVVVEANGEEKPANGHAVVEPHVAEVRNRRVIQALRLVFTMPSNAWYVLWGNFSINTLLLACTLISTFALHTPQYAVKDLTFARVGAVYSDAVKIQVRYPDVHDESSLRTDSSTIKVLYREASAPLHGSAWPEGSQGMWKDGPVVQLNSENDWVGVAHLTKLYPSSTYEFRLAFPNSTFLPYPAQPLSFTTFPDPRLRSGSKQSFVVGSGARLNFPFLPGAPANRIKVLDDMHKWYFGHHSTVDTIAESPVSLPVAEPVAPAEPQAVIEIQDTTETAANPEIPEEPSSTHEAADSPKATWGFLKDFKLPSWNLGLQTTSHGRPSHVPSFMFLLGDVSPGETPLPLKNQDHDAFSKYRAFYDSPSLRKIYESLPLFHVGGALITPTLATSVDIQAENVKEAFQTYSAAANYPGYSQSAYFDFRYGDTAFFVLDTSSYRSGPDIPDYERTLLGSKQTTDLYAWAGKVNQTALWKFIVSPVPFSAMWPTHPNGVEWANFPSERAALLDFLSYIPNVVVISGGRNDFTAIEYTTCGSEKVYEVSTGSTVGAWTNWFETPDESRSEVCRSVRNVTISVPQEGFGAAEEPVQLIDVVTVRQETILKNSRRTQPHWTTFEIDTSADTPSLVVNLVDASNPSAPLWSHEIIAKPVGGKRVNAVGVALADGIKGVLSRMGLGKMW